MERSKDGKFAPGNSGFWKGKSRSEKDRIKMSKPKSKKYVESVAPARSMPVASSVDVLDSNGKYVRTYSLESHGEDFEKLAKGYALKINGECK